MNNLTINRHYPATILFHLRADEEAYKATLNEFGLTSEMLCEPKSRIPMDSYIELYRRVTHLLQDESFGYLSRPLKPGTFSIACDYAANGRSIGDALERLCKFYAIVTEEISLSLKKLSGGHIAFEVALRNPERDRFHFITELFLCIAFRFLSWLAGQSVTLNRARFSFELPPHGNEYMFLFPCEHIFDQEGVNTLEFDEAYLGQPVLKSALDIKTFIERAPEDMLTAILSNDSFSNRVYLALSLREDQEPKIFQNIASDLAMSEQTLRRKLRSEGNSFQNIKDSLRRDTAIFHLLGDRYTVTEISERLEFSTPSAFSRAFKKWTGLSPIEYRSR